MNLDDILCHVYFRNSIHLNTDKVDENDIRNFIEFIKNETSDEMHDDIYVHQLFCVKNKNHFVCENSSLLDKFKVFLYKDDCINIAFMDEYHKGKINILRYSDILMMQLNEVEDPNNYYYDAYELTIYKKDDSTLILNTSTTVSQIRKDMDNFLINLKKAFDEYNK